MAVATTIIVATALLEDDDLVAATLRDDLGRDRQALDRLQLGSVAREQHVAQRHSGAGVALNLLDDDLVSSGNAVLLAASAHDSEHGSHLLSILDRERLPGWGPRE